MRDLISRLTTRQKRAIEIASGGAIVLLMTAFSIGVWIINPASAEPTDAEVDTPPPYVRVSETSGNAGPQVSLKDVDCDSSDAVRIDGGRREFCTDEESWNKAIEFVGVVCGDSGVKRMSWAWTLGDPPVSNGVKFECGVTDED